MIKLIYPKFWNKRSWITVIMIPCSYIYRLFGFIRNKINKKIVLTQKVICVGNITLGGSGKTQIVAWLMQILKQKKIPFVIITKGYRSDIFRAKVVKKTHSAREVGDESIMLKEYGEVIAAKRIKHALVLIKKKNPKIVILDDGMQNPLIKKDLQILAIDSLNPVGNNMIFPCGPLREKVSTGLTKSDLIFMVGNTACKDLKLIKDINLTKKPYFQAIIKLKEDLNKNIEYVAFAGIANPEKFYSLLLLNNFKLKQCISFEDHYNYSNNKIQKLLDLANVNNCHLITTEKDYVKLDSKYKALITCARVILKFKDEQKCIDLIYKKLLF